MKCKHLKDDKKIEQRVIGLNNGYAIEGCCGNCLVIQGIIYCPFCGEKIVKKELKQKVNKK